MWTRKNLKTKAKSFLKLNLGIAIIVCIFYAFLVGIFGNTSYLETAGDTAQTKYQEAVDSGNFDEYDKFLEENSFDEKDGKLPFYFHLYQSGVSIEDYKDFVGIDTPIPDDELFNLFLGGGYKIYLNPLIVVFLMIFSFIGKIFIFNPITIGYKRFFLKGNENIKSDLKFNTLFSSFKDGTWNSIGVKILIKNIYLALWSLLFVIPGIYKYYQYFYVEYILADNPDLSISEAIAISKLMTQDDKVNIWILGLSFIGWELLSSIVLGLGFIILNPYKEATYANLYLTVKENKSNNINELKEAIDKIKDI